MEDMNRLTTEYNTTHQDGVSAVVSIPQRRSEPYIQITVTSPQKVRDLIFAHVIYRVNTRTNFNGFESECTSVSRRYKDFLELYNKLLDKYKHEGRIVPPPPAKDFGGMLSVLMTDEDLVATMYFVQRRMSALERFLNRLAAHPIIKEDILLRDFLQVKADFHRTISYEDGERKGSLFDVFNDSFLFRRRIEETNEWFMRKPDRLESFQIQLRRFYATLKEVIAQRKQLSVATSHMARSINLLSSYEENLLLGSTLVAVATLQEDTQQLYETQACSEDLLLPELINDYIYFTDFVKDVFNERAISCRRLHDAEKELEKKRTAEFKARENDVNEAEITKIRRERIKWEEKVERHVQICNRISEVLREETKHYEKVRAAEFRTALFKWAHIYVDIQEQLTNNCKEFLGTGDESDDIH